MFLIDCKIIILCCIIILWQGVRLLKISKANDYRLRIKTLFSPKMYSKTTKVFYFCSKVFASDLRLYLRRSS